MVQIKKYTFTLETMIIDHVEIHIEAIAVKLFHNEKGRKAVLFKTMNFYYGLLQSKI